MLTSAQSMPFAYPMRCLKAAFLKYTWLQNKELHLFNNGGPLPKRTSLFFEAGHARGRLLSDTSFDNRLDRFVRKPTSFGSL